VRRLVQESSFNIPGQNSSLPPIQYVSLGCWHNNDTYLVSNGEDHNKLHEITPFYYSDYHIERCGLAAAFSGDQYFAVQVSVIVDTLVF